MNIGNLTRVLFSIAATSLVIALANVSVLAQSEATKATKDATASIVAEINGIKIHRDTLERELRRHLQGRMSMFETGEQHNLRKKMLGMIVTRTLLLQEAKKKKVLPKDEEVKKFFTSLKTSFPSVEDFQKQITEFDLTEAEFKEGLAEDLAIQYYLEQIVLSEIEVTDAEIEDEYKKFPEKYRRPEEVKVRHILIRFDEDADEKTQQDALHRASEVRERATAEDADFASLARNFSEALNKGKGGAVEFFTREQMDSDFSAAAFSLKVGEISKLVRTSYGYHVIKLEQKRGGEIPAFEEIKEKIGKDLLKVAQQKTLAEHVLALKEKSKIIVYFQ